MTLLTSLSTGAALRALQFFDFSPQTKRLLLTFIYS